MNYTTASDFEINKRLAEYHGLDFADKGQVFIWDEECQTSSSGMPRQIDYCNNWADIGPLLMKYNIVLTPCMGINKGDATAYHEHENPMQVEFDDDCRALRAAAICIIKVLESDDKSDRL